MRPWIRRLLLIGSLVALAAFAYRRWNRHEFDPTRPRHGWGVVPLRIDEKA